MRALWSAAALVGLLGSGVSAQSSGIRTYCNPVDLDYKYNFEQLNEGISYRSGADPVVVNHNGEYYLFVTASGGYWHSSDLLHWRYIVPTKWPFEDVVAPAAISYRDTLLLLQSTFEPRAILYSTRPETGRLNFYNRLIAPLPMAQHLGAEKEPTLDSVPPGPWDPDIFHDEKSNKWFLYWGSSNVYPIYGIELDYAKRLNYTGKPKPLIYLHPREHGWERFGLNHRDTILPYVEGAWMTEHGGKYYLQYAAPGTEYNVYANGTYVGDSPLGPFSYAPYNPVSYKPGGFITGAGHGNTFADRYGNYWNTGTPWIAINWNFERRIAMFPAGFDRDGQMYSNTRFGDFPHLLPKRKWTNRDELFTGWMLLSYRKPITVSSVRDTFPGTKLVDENPRTFWVAQTTSTAEFVTIDLQRSYDVKALQVNFVDYKSSIFGSEASVYTQFRVSASSDGRRWRRIADLTGEKRDRPNAYIELPRPVHARFVRYENVHVSTPNLAISDIRVFGNGDGAPPITPAKFSARRDVDERNALLTWSRSPGAVGYNILWGIAPDKLYQTYQRFDDEGESLEIRALTLGQSYYFAIEAFNENGVSKVGPTVFVK
ncbi:MAG TPA: family 43 glycosylhydrolase [Gemmatimonadaceae bacterium]|nr:family 43 glycosylhydrolase [Gemmatimonadaceae bacterium]